jgi:hypothetical protein
MPCLAESAEWTHVAENRPARWPLSVLAIGDPASAEFAPVAAELRERTDARFVFDLTSALRVTQAEAFLPDCVVLLENRPGELSREGMEKLRAQAPLARWACVLGSWCEGEFRSGQPWPAAPRVYWHQFRGWFRQELAAIERGDCSPLWLPITATEEERLLQSFLAKTDYEAMETAPQFVAIHSNRREMRELLTDACEPFGCEVVSLPPPQNPPLPLGEGRGEGSSSNECRDEGSPAERAASHAGLKTTSGSALIRFAARTTFPRGGKDENIPPLPPGEGRGEGSSGMDAPLVNALPKPTAAIWDLATLEPPEIAAFAAAVLRSPESHWIVLAGFVREADRIALLRHGASEVLSKPLAIEQLRDALAASADRATQYKSCQRFLFY